MLQLKKDIMYKKEKKEIQKAQHFHGPNVYGTKKVKTGNPPMKTV
jgi:hypothetical protein